MEIYAITFMKAETNKISKCRKPSFSVVNSISGHKVLISKSKKAHKSVIRDKRDNLCLFEMPTVTTFGKGHAKATTVK